AFAFSQDNITGIWKASEMENSTIQVYQADDGLIYGKIIDSDKKEWIGEVILKKVVYDTSEQKWKGEIKSLQRNMTINATLSLQPDGQLKLVGKKYFMSKTFYWERKE
ncbi:MAG: hypothetical protein AAF840_14250, partial [Bacteroidota bacterium]